MSWGEILLGINQNALKEPLDVLIKKLYRIEPNDDRIISLPLKTQVISRDETAEIERVRFTSLYSGQLKYVFDLTASNNIIFTANIYKENIIGESETIYSTSDTTSLNVTLPVKAGDVITATFVAYNGGITSEQVGVEGYVGGLLIQNILIEGDVE